MSRPEDILPPDLYYNDVESQKYTTSSRIQTIQSSMTHRAISLLNISPENPSLILDLGSGSGLSGEILSSYSHEWIGIDISPSMLEVALSRSIDGDLFLADLGQGLPFRPGTFDAAISISVIQWLCNSESNNDNPEIKLKRFFDGLYSCLKRGGRAVLQFYPKNQIQRNMITKSALRAGFSGGIIEDDPETKNVKVYLVLSVGASEGIGQGMDNEINDARRKEVSGRKELIWKKKERMRLKGKIVKSDSKYTGRKRRIRF